jgi:hypothetical protein
MMLLRSNQEKGQRSKKMRKWLAIISREGGNGSAYVP